MNYSSIAILTWGLSGGALANNTTAMAKGFRDLGVKDLYLLYLASAPGKNVVIPDGIKLISLGSKRARWAPVSIAKFIRETKPDVLISVSAFINIPTILGWLLAGKGSTKLIISEHSTMSYKAYVEHPDDWGVRVQPLLARLLYPLANGLRANSQAVLDDLLRQIRVSMPKERVTVITNPVNCEAIASYSKVASDHPWLQQKDKPVIISVARLAKQKNFPLLLEAFKIVRQKLDAQLIILGEGPERRHLESIVTQLGLDEVVSLPGSSANPWCSMAKADIFVLSSEEEPFGLVIVEAMACGVPVVATDAIGGGPRSILESGKYGSLIPNGNAEALAEAILQLMNSPSAQKQFADKGKQRCQAFKPEVIAQQWFLFLKQL